MTSSTKIPTLSKVGDMSEKGIKGLVGKKVSKEVKFLGENIKISKLLVSEVIEIQNKAKQLKDEETEGLELMKTVIRAAVEGGEDLTEEDFKNFPIDDLRKLAEEVMRYSGLGRDEGK